jgi:hypothetical protein
VNARAALGAGIIGVLAVLALGAPAGAADAAPGNSSLGTVTVSNAAPLREGVIEVWSNGWRPHGLVTITMSGVRGPLARATADARGAVHAQVSIPAVAPIGFDVLAVNGATVTGVPQEIVTGLSVIKSSHAPRRVRPWTAVFSLAFLATLLMLVSQKLMKREGSVANPVATT